MIIQTFNDKISHYTQLNTEISNDFILFLKSTRTGLPTVKDYAQPYTPIHIHKTLRNYK